MGKKNPIFTTIRLSFFTEMVSPSEKLSMVSMTVISFTHTLDKNRKIKGDSTCSYPIK